MSERFFVERVAGAEARLIGPEAHHFLHVMRGRVGSEVTLFDGSGVEFRACVERIGRTEVELSIRETLAVDRELPGRLCLGVCLPKADRQKFLVEKCVELGVAELVPLACERGQRSSGYTAGPMQAVARLARYVIEASKQCGRNRLMAIAEPRELAAFVADPSGGLRLLAHPGCTPLAALTADIKQATEIRIAVGPEGGFTNQEVDLARAQAWKVVSLGSRTLRVETAALAAAALVAGAWNQ